MRYLSTLVLLLIATSASAQIVLQQESTQPVDVQNQPKVQNAPRKPIKEHLALPVQVDSLTTINETVRISEYGDAATIIERNLKVASQKVNGYRIVIFMKNAQSARREAVAMQENFALLFPEEQSYLTYEEPYFKVSVGNCTTREEAIVLLGRLHQSFPKAYIAPESIEAKEFTK